MVLGFPVILRVTFSPSFFFIFRLHCWHHFEFLTPVCALPFLDQGQPDDATDVESTEILKFGEGMKFEVVLSWWFFPYIPFSAVLQVLHRSNRAKNFLNKDTKKHQITFVASVRYWRIYPYVWVYSFIHIFISHRHGKVCGIVPVYSYVHKCNALSHVIHLRGISLTRPSRQAI